MSNIPSDFASLREFYYGEYVPIYDFLNSRLVRLPSELHFEVSAAFDHLMRSSDMDEACIHNAVGHLKRATFDGFKLLVKGPVHNLVNKLSHRKYNNVDNGKFQNEVNEIHYKIQDVVVKARGLERKTSEEYSESWDEAFQEWKKVIPLMERLEEMDRSDGACRARSQYVRSAYINVFLYLFFAIIGYCLNRAFDFLWGIFFAL